MKKFIKIAILLVFCGGFLILPQLTIAQLDYNDPSQTIDVNVPTSTEGNHMIKKLTEIGGRSGFQTDTTKASTPIIIGTVVRAFLGFLGLTFIVLFLIAGFKWMTANGNEETVQKATKTITNAIIGLIVALSAWSLWTFFLERIIKMG